MRKDIVMLYRNRVERHKQTALTEEPMRPGQLVRETWDYPALEAIHLAKLDFIRETSHFPRDVANRMYVEIFDVFAMTDEYYEVRDWVLHPPENKRQISLRLAALRPHLEALYHRSIEGDESPAMQLAFLLVRHLCADVDNVRYRLQPAMTATQQLVPCAL